MLRGDKNMKNEIARNQSITSKAVLSSSILLTMLAVCNASPAHAKDDFETKLENAVETFESKKASADRKVEREFSKIRFQVKRDKTLSEASRADMLRRIDQYKRTFKATGKLPNIADTVGLEINYQERLDRAFSPIEGLLEIELKDANRIDDSYRAKDLLKLKRTLETRLLNYRKIAKGEKFHGTFTDKNTGRVIPYKMKIESISDSGDFKAFVDNNPGIAGHRRYRVTGTISGSRIRCSMSENLRGTLQDVRIQGIVAGNRLVAQLDQRTVKGKTTENWIVLQR